MNKKIRNLLAFTVLLFGFTMYGCSSEVKTFQSDLANQIETTEKQYSHLDYVAKDDKTHVEQALVQAKKIGKTTSKSDLTNEISRLKELLNPLKEKSKSIDDAITTGTQIKKNAAINQVNKEKLAKLISESHDFSNYKTFYTSCQTALTQAKTQLIDTVSHQATEAIGNSYIQQSDKTNLSDMLDKIKKAENTSTSFLYFDDLQKQTSKVVENTKVNEANQKAAQAKAAQEQAAAQAKAAQEQVAAQEKAAQEQAVAQAKAAQEQAMAQAKAAQEQATAADSGVVNTSGHAKWAIQDGYSWYNRKGHSHIIPPGGSLPAGFHWQVQ